MTVTELITETLRKLGRSDETSKVSVKVFKFLSSDYKLAALVDTVIRELDLAAEPGPLLNDSLGQRIRGIARTRVSDTEVAERIAALACARLVGRFTGPYLRKILRNEEIDGVSGKIVTGREALDDVPDPANAGQSGWVKNLSREPATPLRVLERRLQLVYGTEDLPAHEMIAFGFNVHLQRKPEDIVLDLGAILIPALARTLYDQYLSTVGGRLEPLCSSLRRLAQSTEPGRRLAEFWNPCETVQRWIDAVRAMSAEAPGMPDGPEALERLRSAPAHRRIAWLLGEVLQYDVATIVARYGDRTLEDLTVLFTEQYAQSRDCSLEDARAQFEPVLALRDQSSVALRVYFDPRRTVSDWVDNVVRRLRRAEARETAQGLGLLFKAYERREPHEILAFLFVQCLATSPRDLALSEQNTTLKELRDKVEHAFRTRFDAGEEEAKAIQNSFKALGRRLGGQAGTHFFLCGNRVEPLADRIAGWRRELFHGLPASLTSGEVAPLFAWRCNLLPDRLLEVRGGGV